MHLGNVVDVLYYPVSATAAYTGVKERVQTRDRERELVRDAWRWNHVVYRQYQ